MSFPLPPIRDKQERDRLVTRVIIIEGTANLLVVIVKAIVGFSTGSVAILADALHSVTDLFNNVIAIAVIRVSVAPPDREHPYGHRQFETLAVFGLATLLTVTAVELVLHAIRTRDQAIVGSPLELGIMLAVLVVNTGLALWQRAWAIRINSNILRADASHTMSDVLTTVVVIVGWQLSTMGYRWLDTLCSIGVALLVFRLAVQLFRRTAPILVESYAIEPEAIMATALKVKGVEEVENIRSRHVGQDSFVDLTIKVDGTLSTHDAHELADQVEAQLIEEYAVFDVAVHIEPMHPKPLHSPTHD